MIGFETAALLAAGFAGGIGAARVYADRAAIWASMQKPKAALPPVGSTVSVRVRKPAKKGAGSVVVPFPKAKAKKSRPAKDAKKRKAG